jgi:hypothetical protein
MQKVGFKHPQDKDLEKIASSTWQGKKECISG